MQQHAFHQFTVGHLPKKFLGAVRIKCNLVLLRQRVRKIPRQNHAQVFGDIAHSFQSEGFLVINPIPELLGSIDRLALALEVPSQLFPTES